MLTEYYCPKCDKSFSEAKLPNINKTHKTCGGHLKIIRHVSDGKSTSED